MNKLLTGKAIKKETNSIRKVTWIGAVSLFALLILFLIVTLFSTNNLTKQIKLLTEHPFAVNTAIGDVKTNLALMRIRTERLQPYNQPEDIEEVRLALTDLYNETDALLKEIDELYLGPDEDVEVLINTYDELLEAHQHFFEFAEQRTSTTDVIAKYEEEHLYPIYDKLEENTSQILSFVRGTQQNIFTSAEKLSRDTIIWSCIIIFATTLGLVFFLSIISKINQRLYLKNQQFEILSTTVDETFLIFKKGSNRCDFVSGSADRILGLSAKDLLEDNTLLYKYMTADTVKEILDTIYSDQKVSWSTFVEFQNPNYLQPRWLQLQYYPISENNVTKCIITLTDLTEERKTNQALQEALESAQKANNAKRDFLSRMSHEIRTPMNAIIGMATIAAASIEDRTKLENCLTKISYSSKHLLMLINDVLDMSRIESNRMNINSEPFEFYQFFSTFISTIYLQAKEKNLELIEKTTGFTENTTFIGDTLRLNQILLNLISNAIKFTPSGGQIRLEVTCLPSRNSRKWLRFVVSDTGIGMDEQGLSHLFTPFEQADSSIAYKYGGTGLGMSITQNLVSLMGGHIKVKSKPNQGTEFTVELPFEHSNVDIQPYSIGQLEDLDVLVVDDEIDICEYTVLLLEKMKINAEWVLSGFEAIERVVSAQKSGHSFDVCFIDWKMPDMDGVETARQIREKIGSDTPIIIISAYDWSDIEAEARAAGVNAFIAKPMFQSSIYNVLVSVTGNTSGINDIKDKITGNSLEGKRLLIAEDKELNMEIVVTLLEMNGATIESVEDGQAAVDRFLETEPEHFDAILMDVQMPVMNGCEATEKIRSCGRPDAQTIPIIATTANAFEEDVSAVLAAGMNAHVGKPIDVTELCTLLTELCEKKS